MRYQGYIRSLCNLSVFLLCASKLNFVSSVSSEDYSMETAFKMIYNSYRQCRAASSDTATTCLKLKAVKLVERALSVNSIPLIEGVSLTRREEKGRALNFDIKPVDEGTLPKDAAERGRTLDTLLWEKLQKFFESRSLQLKFSKLFPATNAKYPDDSENLVEDGRGKKDKDKGMQMYLMMMKGGMLAIGYKAVALLAGKALLVSKVALTLALIVAIKKLFSSGHSQKTTYEIVKTPVITHSHQYSGSSSHGGELTGYEGTPYARSFDVADPNNGGGGGFYEPKYVTTRIVEEMAEGRSAQGRSLSLDEKNRMPTVPYAHLAAYRNQLKSEPADKQSGNENQSTTSSVTQS